MVIFYPCVRKNIHICCGLNSSLGVCVCVKNIFLFSNKNHPPPFLYLLMATTMLWWRWVLNKYFPETTDFPPGQLYRSSEKFDSTEFHNYQQQGLLLFHVTLSWYAFCNFHLKLWPQNLPDTTTKMIWFPKTYLNSI